MNVFITGATGFIGSAVSAACARAGHRVFGLTRSKEKAPLLAAREIEPVVGSIDAPAGWLHVARHSSAIVHCAAEYGARYLELDRQVAETLCTLTGRGGQARTFVYTSGVWVYGDTRGECVDEASDLRSPALVRPRAVTEQAVLAANGAHLHTLVIRPGCVYGGSGSLTGQWFHTATTERQARFVGPGTQRWAMIHLEDLADLYVRALESGRGGEVFNATDRSRSTVRECAEAASRASGAEGKVATTTAAEAAREFGPMAECLALDQHVDSSKAVRLLGWQPRHAGFVDGVERYHAAWSALAAR